MTYGKIVVLYNHELRKNRSGEKGEKNMMNAIKELANLNNEDLNRAMAMVHGSDEAKARAMEAINDYRVARAELEKIFRK